MALHVNYSVTKEHIVIVLKMHVWEYFYLYQAEINVVHDAGVGENFISELRSEYHWVQFWIK